AGDIGIGTSSPEARLDVNGSLRARGNTILDGSLTVGGATVLNGTLGVAKPATFADAVTVVGLLRANGGITTNTLAATTSVTTPLLTNAGTLTLAATGTAPTIIASTAGIERLRVTAGGRVGINTLSDANTGAALQVNTGADATVGLLVRGNSATQTADLLQVVRGNGSTVLSVDERGSLTLLPYGTAAGTTNELRFATLAAGQYVGFRAPNAAASNLIWTLPSADGAGGNVLATNGDGVLSWINPLTAASGWTVIGNASTNSGGALGAVPTDGSNFLGTLDNTDLRVVTGNRVRAIFTAGGQFQTNDVAIGGGSINGTAIGNVNPSTGAFTTVDATTSVTTPLLQGSGLQVSASAGDLSLRAIGNVIGYAGGSERFRIVGSGVNAGNVGIGNNAPTNRLDVTGTFRATGATTIGGALTASSGITTTTLNASGAVTLGGGTANGVAYLNGSKVLTTGSALTFDGTNLATTGTATATKLIPTGGTAVGNGMYLPATNTLAFSTNGAERLRIDATGQVGIGMTPGRTLDVTGTFGVTGASTLTGAATLGSTLSVTGTTTLSALGGVVNTSLTGLDRVVMTGSTGQLSQLSTSSFIGATAWALVGNAGTNAASNFLGTTDAVDLAIRTNNAERVRVLGSGANAGFVGIGVAAPTAL
ncbi:MAG: hypothetical protein EBS39_11685, partial [Gammaproteobacteria bacterium]|nr:hypothetical protein [Gammaproteobacteria bacterium]